MGEQEQQRKTAADMRAWKGQSTKHRRNPWGPGGGEGSYSRGSRATEALGGREDLFLRSPLGWCRLLEHRSDVPSFHQQKAGLRPASAGSMSSACSLKAPPGTARPTSLTSIRCGRDQAGGFRKHKAAQSAMQAKGSKIGQTCSNKTRRLGGGEERKLGWEATGWILDLVQLLIACNVLQPRSTDPYG